MPLGRRSALESAGVREHLETWPSRLRFTPDHVDPAAGGGPSGQDMSEELFAISKVPPAQAAQGDYDSICAALMHTERGRWFLQEYARRNRNADTQVLLAAIQRIEAVVCAERNKRAQQGFRTDLLEMAKAITRTRAEVAEIRSDASHPESVRPGDQPPPPPKTRDVFSAAERIRDVTWAMRGHGFDPSTCDQLEELADTILSASSLRDPTDHRAHKLSEVLQYLERRIDTLLESSQDGDAAAPEPAPAPVSAAFGPVPSTQADPANGFAGPIVIVEPELAAGDVEASRASPHSPNDSHSVAAPIAVITDLEAEAEAEVEAEADVEADATASSPPAEVEMAAQAVAPEPQPEPELEQSEQGPASGPEASSIDLAAAEPLTAPGRDTAEPLPAAEPAAGASAAPSAAVAAPDDLPAQAEAPATAIEAAGENEPQWTPATDGGAAAIAATAATATAATATAAGARPWDALMPSLELTAAGRLPPTSPDVQAALMARWQAPARTFLPELDLRAQWPDFGAAPASTVLLAVASPPPEALAALPTPWLALEAATHFDGEVSTIPEPSKPRGATPAPVVSEDPSPARSTDATDVPAWPGDQPAPGEPAAGVLTSLRAVAAPTQPAADASMPQPADADPLAALKAMSDDELIALFS
jgi:hypothetical protein